MRPEADEQRLARGRGCVVVRMAHRAGILVPDNAFYLFQDGLINGVTWTGSAQGYSSYEISDVLKARGYIWSGVSGTGSSSIITYVDLRGFRYLHFAYSAISVLDGECPNIRACPNYVSTPSEGEGPWEAVYDLSAIPDLSNQLIMIQSGHVSKSSTSGSINASITVNAVWATRE